MRIFLALLLLLLLLLLIPVSLGGGYDGEASLELRYLFFKKRLLPKAEAKAGRKTKKKSARPKKQKRPFPLKIPDILELLPKAAERLLPPVRRLLKRTTLARFSLEMVVAGSDAADTAIKFGKINGAVFYAVALLDRLMTLKTERVDIYPGFGAEQSKLRFSAQIRLCPLVAIIAAFQLGISGLLLLIPAIRRRKQKNAAEARRLQNDDRKDDCNGKEEPVGRSA